MNISSPKRPVPCVALAANLHSVMPSTAKGLTMTNRFVFALPFLCAASVCQLGCDDAAPLFDQREPAAGPGSFLPALEPLSTLPFAGGDDAVLGALTPAATDPGTCDAACQAHCAAAPLSNPIHQALCPTIEGRGLSYTPVVAAEACRRLFADTLGRFPTKRELDETCLDRPMSAVVANLLARPEFVKTQRRIFADLLLYHNEVISTARIWDADEVVGKVYAGLIPWDQFAAIIASHPVLTRRYANPADRAEAAFRLFIGRPPYQNERADLARLYNLWTNDYYEHPGFGRTPDAFVRYECVNDSGDRDDASAGACTSVLWGSRELILNPDVRTEGDKPLWSGLLNADEWFQLQEPGRVLASLPAFWEHAVDRVSEQYLGYNPSLEAPAIREALVRWLLLHNGDIRSVHFAVLTSRLYLQSALTEAVPGELVDERGQLLRGPLKQADAEVWLDTLEVATQQDLGACDHRLPDPNRLLNMKTVSALALVAGTDWPVAEDGTKILTRYRDLARSLGGCPENLAGGRFKTVSILTTATQESFVESVCNPALLDSAAAKAAAAPIAVLLPGDLADRQALDAAVAQQVLDHQVGTFFGRSPTEEERALVAGGADACVPRPCTAETFARPLCFALLSGAETLFY